MQSLDFPGPREVVPAPLHAHQPAAVSNEAQAQNFQARWVPQISRDADPNELVFRRVRGLVMYLTILLSSCAFFFTSNAYFLRACDL